MENAVLYISLGLAATRAEVPKEVPAFDQI
jgi:hypothetical protein